MKKKILRKLNLSRETVREWESSALQPVAGQDAGGSFTLAPNCQGYFTQGCPVTDRCTV